MVFETTKCLHERRVAAESSISACAQAKLARQDDGIKVDPAAVVGEQRDPAQEQDCRRSDERRRERNAKALDQVDDELSISASFL